MQKDDLINNYEPLWNSWKVNELIGEGSIGKVYRITKNFYSTEHVAAAKFITIPTKEQSNTFNNITDFQSNKKEYFEDIVKNIADEINLLYCLKGNENIISYEDCMVEKVKDKDEWHIIIRMEYAKSLTESVSKNNLSIKEIVKIGIDICKALEKCHSKGILHRDIKEANIFISDEGIYKLGDFSVSRQISNVTSFQTKVGTENYMAPEVIRSEGYSNTADIYSLGIMLYKLLNNRRFPFIPRNFKQSNVQEANLKRVRGEQFDNPENANERLSKIILKACSFKPEMRYQNAKDMGNELRKYLDLDGIKNTETYITNEVTYSEVDGKTYNLFSPTDENSVLNEKMRKVSSKIKIIAGVSAFIILLIVFFVYINILGIEGNKVINSGNNNNNIKNTEEAIIVPGDNNLNVKTEPQNTKTKNQVAANTTDEPVEGTPSQNYNEGKETVVDNTAAVESIDIITITSDVTNSGTNSPIYFQAYLNNGNAIYSGEEGIRIDSSDSEFGLGKSDRFHVLGNSSCTRGQLKSFKLTVGDNDGWKIKGIIIIVNNEKIVYSNINVNTWVDPNDPNYLGFIECNFNNLIDIEKNRNSISSCSNVIVITTTGTTTNSYTDDPVYIQLSNDSNEYKLNDSEKNFENGETDNYLDVTGNYVISKFNKLQLRLDGTDDWKFRTIIILMNNDIVYYGENLNTWLSDSDNFELVWTDNLIN